MDQIVWKKLPSKPEGNGENLPAVVSSQEKWIWSLVFEFGEVLCYSDSGKEERDANVLLTTKQKAWEEYQHLEKLHLFF